MHEGGYRRSKVFRSLLLAVAFAAVAACSAELSREELLARADAALAGGDLTAAEVDIKSVLQNAPEDAQARRMYGHIYLERMNPVAAAEQFERSLKAEEDRDTRLWLARSLPRANQGARLVEDWQSGRFITVETAPEFQASLALALMAEVREDDARAAMDRALASADADNDYVQVCAAIVALQLDGDTFGAEDRLKAVVERDPANAQAQSLLGLIATRARDYEAAEQYFLAATEANAFRLGDQLQLVETQIRLGKGDAADGRLATLERQIPKNMTVNLLRGQLLFDSGEYAEAVNLFNQILSVNPNNLAALLLSANANARIDKTAVAQRQFEDYLVLRPGDVQVRLQLAQIYALNRLPQKSEAMARSVIEIQPENETAMQLLASALSAQGRHAESAEVLATLADKQPDSTATRIALGSQQLVAGDVESGLAELQRAVDDAPDSATARERLIEAKLAVGDLDGAAAEAMAYREQSPESTRAAVFLGRVRLQEGNSEQAQDLFERALELDPTNSAAYGGLAALAVVAGDLEKARDTFQASLEANPGDLLTSVNLAVVLERLEDIPAMEAVLNDAVEANPTAIEARLPLARLSLSRGDASGAIEMLQPVLESAPDDVRAYDLTARAYFADEQYEQAQATVRKLMDLAPGNVGALALAAQVSIATGDAVEAEGYLREAIKLRSENTELRKLLVDALMAQQELEKAADEIDLMSPEALREPRVLLLRGRLASSLGDPEGARSTFARAHELEPSSVTLVALSSAEWNMGLQEEVIARQEAWLAENPEDQLVRRDYASRVITRGDEATAIGEYERLVQEMPEDIASLNNLAWLLRESDTERALEYIQQADKLAPDNAQVKDTFAMIELERGDIDMALRLNQRALDLDNGNLDIQFNRAKVLARAGRSGEASTIIERLLSNPDFSASDEARDLQKNL